MADNYLLREQAAQLAQWMYGQAQGMEQAVGISSQQMQELQMQTIQNLSRIPQGLETGLWGDGFGSAIGGGMSQPGMSHLGAVREFRRKFKEYTKAEFREMGRRPVIKEILSGMTKLNKEQIQERIAEHLATV